MLQLLEAGVVQAKLRVSQPGDPDEVEADRVAEKVVSASRAPVIQRKCACEGGTPCSKCAGERDEETIHRSVATPLLRSSKALIQRSPADPSSSPAATSASAAPEKQPAPGAKPAALVVEDNAAKVEPHQMRKSQFIALLRTEACAAADAALASVKHTTKGCPYVVKWLSFYEKQSSQHIEQAIRKYAPEAAGARSAREAIGILVRRIERAAITWARTGKVEGLPKDLASQFPGQGGVLGAVHDFASTKVGGAILGFIGGTKKQEDSGPDQLQRKARTGEAAPPAHDAAAVKAQLGGGHSLDSRVQSQMSSAFGHDFSGVRVHTDSSAAKVSSDLQARAFTVGNDVAFASGEYRPGTLIGDALIAHELAHVVQQSGAYKRSASVQRASGEIGVRLEEDADQSALGAVASLWAIGKGRLTEVGKRAGPALKSGLRLQRCGRHDPVPNAVPEIPATQEELGKHAVSCMIQANSGPHTRTSGIWYAEGYKQSFPDDWDDDYANGYANPEYWERIAVRQWRLKKGRSASAGVKAWLKGLTIAECYSTAIVSEVDSVRAAVGDAKFDQLYGSEDQAVEPRLELGQKGSNALHGGTLQYVASGGAIGTIGHRPASVGEWHYFYNHPKYLLKHPAGVYQGENAMLRAETAPNGDQLWEGLGQRKVTERQMYMNMMRDYNRPRNDWDNKRLERIRAAHGGTLPPEYDPTSGIFPDRLTTYEEILTAPAYSIDGETRQGGYDPRSRKSLDPARVQELRDMP
jgi:hypothetical protein